MGIEFGYWKLRGFGNPIRMILDYVQADFTEKTYEAHKLGDNKEGNYEREDTIIFIV